MTTTYSFADVSCTISHPLTGSKTVSGEGIGKILVSYTDELTGSDLAADGSVMITKIASTRGKVSFEIQQTSSLNKWLLAYANAVTNADASYWASASIAIGELFDNGVNTNANEVALVKRPDRSDAQQGDKVTWDFFVGDLEVA